MSGKIGFNINKTITRPPKEMIEQISVFATPNISDSLNKFNVMSPDIKPVLDEIKICGPAVTVRMRPGDNLMLHKVGSEIQPGDIVVVDTCGSSANSVIGDLMTTALVKAGVGGIVIDGGIRDILELRAEKYPVFYRYITPAVGDKDGPGEINGLISCGGVPVRPGDIILGDANGVVVIPQEIAEEAIAGAKKKLEYEAARRKEIEAGIIVKEAVDEQLRKKGVID